MSRKTVAKSLADGVVPLAIPVVYIMRISYDSAAVNIFVFYWTKKHFISEWHFTTKKNHEIGSLVVRKVKKSWDSRQNRELGVEEQLLIFSPCLSPGRVKKLQMFINFCLKVGHRLIWNIQSPHELRKLIVLRKVQTHNIKLDTMHAQHFLIAERDDRSSTLVVLHRGLSCEADWLRKCPHLSDTFAYRSAQNNLFLTLRVIHTSKKERKEFRITTD